MFSRTLGATLLVILFGSLLQSPANMSFVGGMSTAVAAPKNTPIAPVAWRTFVQKYQRAHERRDLEAALRLVYWQGADARNKQMMRQLMQANLSMRIKRLSWTPLQPGEDAPYKMFGVTYGYNLRPTGWLRVDYAAPGGKKMLGNFSGSQMVGIKDGVYYFVSGKPVAR